MFIRLIFAGLVIANFANAATCPDLTGQYQLPQPGTCALLDELGRHVVQPFLSPFHSEDAHGIAAPADGLAGGSVLKITQSGCEKVRLELCQDARCEQILAVNDWQIPGRIVPTATANGGAAFVQWDHPVLGPAALAITHVYKSPLAVGGLFNRGMQRLGKTWELWLKRDGRLELFTRLDYSAFHRPDRSDCVLQRASIR